MIVAIVAGLVGFALLTAADELALRKRRAGRVVCFALSCVILGGALVSACLLGPRLDLPPAVRVIGAVLGAGALALVVVSLLLEVPTHRIYLGAAGPKRLVTTGTYALCRHPGVPFLAVFLVSLALATRSRDLAVAAPVWIALDSLHVVRQERRYLIPVFGSQYVSYQAQVPMLLPTITSIRRALAGRGNTGEPNGDEQG